MTDHESNDGLTLATLIGLSGVIIATSLAVVLFAVRILAAMEARLGEFGTVSMAWVFRDMRRLNCPRLNCPRNE